MTCCKPLPAYYKDALVLSIKKGESLGFPFSLTINQRARDISWAQVEFKVREEPEDTGIYVISKTVKIDSDLNIDGLITDPVSGEFFIKINAADTKNLSTSKPYYLSMFLITNGIRECISASDCHLAKFLVLNP